MRRDDLAKLGMVFGIVRADQDGGLIEGRFFPVQSCQNAARLDENEIGRGVVPREDTYFEVEIAFARRQIAQLDGAAPESPKVSALAVRVENDVAADRRKLLAVKAHRGA